MSAIVFMDTETTGLSLDDDIWEVAAVRREEDGTERELHLFLKHAVHKCRRLPEPFLRDHDARYPGVVYGAVSPREASLELLNFIGKDRPHIVGAVPNFDTERLLIMMRRSIDHDLREPWHYHLIDVENLAVGYLLGRSGPSVSGLQWAHADLPWDSNALSAAIGVDPERFERHTALGDVRWAMAIYDAVTHRVSS